MVEKRGPKAGGYKSSTGARSGGYERKPRAEGERAARPYVKREGAASGGYAKKSFGDGERKPYAKREGGYDRKPREGSSERSYERKPRGEGSAAARRPYEGSNPREMGDRESRPYTPRGDGDRKPYAKREGGYERKSFGDGERKPYAKREGGFDRKPREGGDRPYTPRAPREGGYERKSFGDGERKPYAKREGGFDRKPREGGERSYAPRAPREGGDRPYTPRAPREEGAGGYERKPYAGRRESFDRGDSTSAKFAEKRTIKRDRRPAEDSDTGLMRGDGWLIGYHAVLAALATGRRKVRAVWLLSEAQGELGELIAKNPDWIIEIHSKPDFERQFGEMVHQGVAALVGNLPQPSLPELLSEKPKLVVALDQITDPHNLGAIVRSCAAFGAQGVLVTEHRAAGLNATAAKVAAGAMEVVPVVEITNLAQSLEMMKEAGFTILGLAGDAEVEIGEIKNTGPICLVLGSEGEGLRRLTRETCDTLVKISISSKMESLNVSVATGVALSILTRK